MAKVREKSGLDAAVLTIFCDGNKKYLSTALMNEESPRAEYLAPRIELLGIGTVGRACELPLIQLIAGRAETTKPHASKYRNRKLIGSAG